MDYQRIYFTLFNAITDALRELSNDNIGNAMVILSKAQMDAENQYIECKDNRIEIFK